MMSVQPTDLVAGPLQLRDGRRVWFRPIRADDAERLRRLHRRLSPETRRRRFFTPLRELSPKMAAERFAEVDHVARCAVVICHPGEDEIRGVGRYEANGDGSAEIAFVIEDGLQGNGLGKQLLYLLASHGRRQGITRFTATVLPDNQPMLKLFRTCGFPASFRLVDGNELVELDITVVPNAADVLCPLTAEETAEADDAANAVDTAKPPADLAGHRREQAIIGAASTAPAGTRGAAGRPTPPGGARS